MKLTKMENDTYAIVFTEVEEIFMSDEDIDEKVKAICKKKGFSIIKKHNEDGTTIYIKL